MNKYSLMFYLLPLAGVTTVQAQQTAVYTTDVSQFNNAVHLFKEKQYQAAQILFQKIKENTNQSEIQSDCAYYIANCAIRLDQSDANQLIESFVEDYPTSSKRNQAYIEAGLYYFDKGKFPAALEWLEKVDQNALNASQKDKFNFAKAYTYFVSDDKEQAKKYFERTVKSKEFGDQSKYYLGYLAYEGDNYKQAKEYFNQVSEQEEYKDKLSYFQADMNFKSGEFSKAIEEGKKQLPKANAQEKSELNKIIGESYFNLAQYKEAIPYLSEYKGKKGKWNNTDFYQLGYAYYKQADYVNAISQFNKIIDGKDAVAQNAYYHLGESYLKTDKKQQALNAFKNASEMDFDLKIQEDAFLNYAKISYEIGNTYQSIPGVLAAFIEKYPNNPSRQEIETLLVNSYITSKNYKEALVILEKNKTYSSKEAYQKVAFYRGLELYTDGNYQEALSYFIKSINEPIDQKFLARATFWKAETEFTLNNFQEALLSFKQFEGNIESKTLSENKNLNYNLGYTYFKLKDYEKAATYYQSFIDNAKNDKVRINDAYLRMADSYFVSGKYWPAMEAYNKAIELKGIDADYAAFQKGISYGFVDRNDRKIEDLNNFVKNFKNSQYRDDALFELANTYMNTGKSNDAIKIYDQLLTEYPKGGYSSRAILRQGLIHYNAQKDDLALVKFKKVVAEYPGSAEAIEAVNTARLIYVDSGNVEEYATWVKTLNFVEISDVDLDNTTFESAEKQYLQGNSKQAIAGFTTYLAKFPKGLNQLKANFYLAEMYYTDKLESRAIPHYKNVIDLPRNVYTEQSLVRLCDVYLKQENFTEVIPVLKRLETEAEFPQNVTFAQANLMRAYYNSEDYTNTVVYAEKVLANDKTDAKVKSDAQIMIARSAFKTGNDTKAKQAYDKVRAMASGELAAEAQYYDAYFKNKEKQYEQSNVSVQKLTKDYAGYKYFGVKGMVIMAKNFYQLKDSYQATVILETIIKNFKEFEDVVTEAQTELDFIKSKEAERNSSVGK